MAYGIEMLVHDAVFNVKLRAVSLGTCATGQPGPRVTLICGVRNSTSLNVILPDHRAEQLAAPQAAANRIASSPCQPRCAA